MDYTPDFTVENHGFYGKLFKPAEDRFPGKALILYSGSDGRFALPCLVAKLFADHGLTVLAGAFWNVPGLPDTLNRIPLETAERAAQWLRNSGYEKIGLWGISMGAEFVLLAGIHMPELITCVVAASPICLSSQGLGHKMQIVPHSVFTWRSKELPYMPFTISRLTKKMVFDYWRRSGDFGVRFCYDPLVAAPQESCILPVERLGGPVLFISGGMDSMWPADESARILMRRLDEKGFAHEHRHLSYEHGSHYMVPLHLYSEKVFRAERLYKQDSERYKQDQLRETLAFLSRW